MANFLATILVGSQKNPKLTNKGIKPPLMPSQNITKTNAGELHPQWRVIWMKGGGGFTHQHFQYWNNEKKKWVKTWVFELFFLISSWRSFLTFGTKLQVIMISELTAASFVTAFPLKGNMYYAHFTIYKSDPITSQSSIVSIMIHRKYHLA